MIARCLIAISCLMVFVTAADARGRNAGYRITCLRQNDYCSVERIQSGASMHWYAGVFVEGDGDLGRERANSQDECEDLCDANSRCVMAEFYFGGESRRPVCNMFSSMKRLKLNSSGDATVGVWE